MASLLNSVMNLFVPPASLVVMACAWPALCFINTFEWLYNSFYGEDMEDKVVIVTGASSGIGEQIAYEYAKRRVNLVLVARRENRLRAISEKARLMGAKHVMIVAADVVKEDDCRRFVDQTVSYYGRVDHLVNTVSLGHTFYLEEAVDTSVFPHLMDINFWGNVYPTYVALPHLHQTNGRIVVNAAVETWLPLPRMSLYAVSGSGSSGHLENYAKMIVSGACRGNQYVKCPSWYDIFLLYRFFAPGILNWTVRQVLASHGARRTSLMGTGRPLLEGSPSGSPSAPRNLIAGPVKISSRSPVQMQKLE
ncbi:11-beta-hydroxysteroid dehydrogenase B [Linum perenne]